MIWVKKCNRLTTLFCIFFIDKRFVFLKKKLFRGFLSHLGIFMCDGCFTKKQCSNYAHMLRSRSPLCTSVNEVAKQGTKIHCIFLVPFLSSLRTDHIKIHCGSCATYLRDMTIFLQWNIDLLQLDSKIRSAMRFSVWVYKPEGYFGSMYSAATTFTADQLVWLQFYRVCTNRLFSGTTVFSCLRSSHCFT